MSDVPLYSRVIDSVLVGTSLGRVPREQKMLKNTYTESYITKYTSIRRKSSRDIKARVGTLISSHKMYSSIGFRESTPPRNRQLNVLMSNSEHEFDDFVTELTF